MIFAIIVFLSLVAGYLLVASGTFSKTIVNPNKDFPILGEDEDPDGLKPGMFGSKPSNEIDAFDNDKLVTIPSLPGIDALINTFKDDANQVYSDFQKNKNSAKYKSFQTNLYRIDFLQRTGNLSATQLGSFNKIKNTIVYDIENLLNYHLDLIKYDNTRSYYKFRRHIIDDTGTKVTFDVSDIYQILSYILQGTNLPGRIIILLKHKLDLNAQDILEDISMAVGYNYYRILEILSTVLVREPQEGTPIVDISNLANIRNGVIHRGFWTDVYQNFIANNINNIFIDILRESFVSERVYKAILATIISYMQNVYITEAINNLVYGCKTSGYKLIRDFPFRFSFELLKNAIKENEELIAKHGKINLGQLDKEFVHGRGVENIQVHQNIALNFPVIVQKLTTIIENDEVDFTNNMEVVTYPILTDDYVINNYLSFPKLTTSGIYFDRRSDYPTGNVKGCILIENTHSTSDITISGLAIYAVGETNYLINSNIPMEEAFVDNNVIFMSDIITVGRYTYNPNATCGSVTSPACLTTRMTFLQDVTTEWKTGNDIILRVGQCLKISATPISSTTGSTILNYVRIFGLLIPIIPPKVGDYLRVSVIPDSVKFIKYTYNYNNIPSKLWNTMVMFDSDYKVSYAGDILSVSRSSDTFVVVNSLNKTNKINIIKIAGSDSNGAISTETPVLSGIDSTLVGTSTGAGGTISTNTRFTANGILSDTTAKRFSASLTDKYSYSFAIRNTNNDRVLTIKKIIVFGNATYTDDLFIDGDLYGGPSGYTMKPRINPANFLSDGNVLMRGSHVNAYTLVSSQEIGGTYNNVIYDNLNRNLDNFELRSPGTNSTLYVEPVIIPSNTNDRTKSANTRYTNIYAIYIEFGFIVKDFEIHLFKFEGEKRVQTATLKNIPTLVNDATLGYLFIIDTLTNFVQMAPFSVFPDNIRKEESFSVIPTYGYDNFYDPISELIQSPDYYL
jgi:hypothetical protein